jgi:DNA-binding NarL/FixJ family response regulator
MWRGRRFVQYVTRPIQKKTSRSRLGVLVAEDSAATRESLSELLSGLPGMELLGLAKDGTEAMEGVRSLDPDVLILDIHMPRRNGLQVLRAVRKRKNHCLVIVLTKLSDDFYREKCRELKADYFFDKLTEFDQFVNLLKSL